jgi:hypothetical protein
VHGRQAPGRLVYASLARHYALSRCLGGGRGEGGGGVDHARELLRGS